MLHRLLVKVVTRQLPPENEVVIHKVFQYSPDLLSCQGVKDIDQHINLLIAEDINKFKDEFVEFRKASFIVKDIQAAELTYIG